MVNKKRFSKEFENIIEMAELRALSKHSLEQPLTDKQYVRFMELGKKQRMVFPNGTKK
jgi:hypothetical protein